MLSSILEKREYCGECTISFDFGDTMDTTYELSFIQGRISVKCIMDVSHKKFAKLMSEYSKRLVKASMAGSVEQPEGKIKIDTLYLNVVHLGFSKAKQETYAIFRVYDPVSISFTSIDEEETIEIHFGLTNLLFRGCEWSQRELMRIRDKLTFTLDNNTFEIRQVEDFENVSRSLKENPNVHITSELITHVRISEVKETRKKVENVLTLLSLVSGNWVANLYCDIYAQQKLCRTDLRPEKTHPYRKGEPLIDLRHIGNCDLKDFLETTYADFVQKRDDLGLAIVMEYAVTSKTAPMLETKYLLAAIAFECLTSYLPAYFQKKGTSVDLTTFKKKIIAIMDEFKVSYDSIELKFVDTRDKVVHTGRFPQKVDPLMAWYALSALLDRTLLTIIGYRGKPYLDALKGFARVNLL